MTVPPDVERDFRLYFGQGNRRRFVANRKHIRRSLPPGEAFSVLGNDVRVAILQTLWDADVTMAYSELKSAIGTNDSGRFYYHLLKILEHFVERTEAGYRLRVAGNR